MLKGRFKFEKSQQAEQCFVKVNELLALKSILQIADFTYPFYLFLDALSSCWCCSMQVDMHVAYVQKSVCSFCHKLFDCQKR